MKMISVIIPVYNMKKYLRPSLNSVLKQRSESIEIILVNDGSTDGSQFICEEYARKYDTIVLVQKENGGLSDARNEGLKSAKGDYILFLDADDLLEDNVLADLEKFVEMQKRPDMVLFDYTKFYQKRKEFEPVVRNLNVTDFQNIEGRQAIEILLKKEENFNWLVCQNIYKREFILVNELYFEKGRLYEDVLWLPQVFLKAKTVSYYKRKIHIYRLERDGQITATISQKSLLDNIYIPVFWKSKLKDMELKKELKELLMYSFTNRYYYSIWFLGFLPAGKRKEVIKELKNHRMFLKYANDRTRRATNILIQLFGFNGAGNVLKLAIETKRKLSNK